MIGSSRRGSYFDLHSALRSPQVGIGRRDGPAGPTGGQQPDLHELAHRVGYIASPLVVADQPDVADGSRFRLVATRAPPVHAEPSAQTPLRGTSKIRL